MGMLDAILAGVMTGVGGAGTAVARGREDARDRALKEREVKAREDQLALERERAFVDIPVESIPLPFRPAGMTGMVKVDRGLAPVYLTMSDKLAERERRQAGDRMVAAGIPNAEATMMFTSPEEGAGMSPIPADPKARAVKAGLESGIIEVKEALPFLFPKREGFTIGPGQERYDENGRLIAAVPPMPKERNLGERREALIDTVLVQKGYVPGTPEFNEQKLNLTRTFQLTEGGMVFGGSQLIPPAPGAKPAGTPGQPGGPAPLAQGPQKPIEATAAQLVVGAAAARKASQEVLTALKDPIVLQYIGPYGQYRSTVQGKAPFEALGKIPPAVVQLEQNIARVRNYTIKLITGAQMSEPEAKRIMGEMPGLDQQPDVLAQRMAATDANNAMMENIVRSLVLRGSPQAADAAKELGLDVGTKLGGPAGIGNVDPNAPLARPPKAPAQGQAFDALPPAAQFTGRTMKNPATGQRVKSDGQQWVPVP